jgi:hypothetical protein
MVDFELQRLDRTGQQVRVSQSVSQCGVRVVL